MIKKRFKKVNDKFKNENYRMIKKGFVKVYDKFTKGRTVGILPLHSLS